MPSLNQTTLQDLYQTDEPLWLEQTVRLLAAGQFGALDIENLVEELKQLGRSHFNRVRSLLKQIIIHLLLLEYWQAEYDYNHRHWRGELVNFRDALQQNLTPSLKNKLDSEVDAVYTVCIRFLVQKTGLPASHFPPACPYTWTQLLAEDWYPLQKC